MPVTVTGDLQGQILLKQVDLVESYLELQGRGWPRLPACDPEALQVALGVGLGICQACPGHKLEPAFAFTNEVHSPALHGLALGSPAPGTGQQGLRTQPVAPDHPLPSPESRLPTVGEGAGL